MALAGTGAILIWNDITPDGRADYYQWHAHEHMPERVAIPGFLRGRRYIAATPATSPEFFTMYETADPRIPTSAPYLARLNAPTAWSLKAMAQFRNMLRALTAVVASAGPGSGGVMATVRLPETERGVQMLAKARGIHDLAPGIAALPRIAGAHLCATDADGSAIRTTESRDRGDSTTVPCGVLLIEGCDRGAVEDAVAAALSRLKLTADEVAIGIYILEHEPAAPTRISA